LNLSALIAVAVFAAVLLSIFGGLYIGALRSHARGDMDIEGIRLLRWALLGHITLYVLLAITAFLT
jgi:hypothetical protein